MRDAFIRKLHEEAKIDKDIIFISNEQGAVSLDKFREDLPKQFINAGISEQNIISVAAGMAHSKKKVIVYSIASFITLRCFEQIKIDLCVMNLPVTILGVGSCYSYSTDGPTHHATEDISIIRTLSNMKIYSPSDSVLTSALVSKAISTTTPMYIRLDRQILPVLYKENQTFDKGFKIIKEGKDYCIIATGIMVHKAIDIANALKKRSISAQVIDLYRIKPIDVDIFTDKMNSFSKVITLEEHTLNGGLGGIIAEIFADKKIMVEILRFGIEDKKLYDYGERELLHFQRNLDVKGILKRILS